MDVAMRAMADRDTNAHDLAKRLGITTTTLYMYVNGDGTVKQPGRSCSTGLSYEQYFGQSSSRPVSDGAIVT